MNRTTSDSEESACKASIDRMLRLSQTKVIFPLITLGLLEEYRRSGKTTFTDNEVRKSYYRAVEQMAAFLQHKLHIGGKYEDAYPVRASQRYGVLVVGENKRYELQESFRRCADPLAVWIPERIRTHISEKLGIVPLLGDRLFRIGVSSDPSQFVGVIEEHIDKNPTNFEIFCFAIIRVHLEKFACKVYRDTRTSSHDTGVDLSTNFGVVYQIKQLQIHSQAKAEILGAELRKNFDSQRLNDGNVILVIDDISRDVKQYLINMKVQSITKSDLIKLANQFDDPEDREKVLRIVHDEFRREYESLL